MKLAELQISSTLIKWPEFLTLLDHMSSVTYVEMGLNRLTELPTPKGASEHSYRIKVLNLDSNQLHDWVDLCNALKHFPR